MTDENEMAMHINLDFSQAFGTLNHKMIVIVYLPLESLEAEFINP